MKRRLFLSLDSAPIQKDGLWRVEIIRCGDWDYPRPGEKGFSITPQTIHELAENFGAGIMGREVPLNIDHKEGADCGWVKAVEVGPSTLNENEPALYGLVEITDPAVLMDVQNGTLRYSSAELDFERICPERSAMGDLTPRKVLEGLALTNHPYIKGMAPISPAIQLSDKAASAALNAAQAHYNGLAQVEVDPGATDPGIRKTEEEQMQAELTEAQRQIDDLKIRLAEAEKNSAGSAALAETRKLGAELGLRDVEDQVKRLVGKGKVTPALGRRVLRFAEIMIKGGAQVVSLSEMLSPRKYKLAEGDDDSGLSKMDVVGEVVDMLKQLPDAMAMDPASAPMLAEDGDDDRTGGAADDDEKIVEEATKVSASEKIPFRDALKKVRLARSGGKK